jgi:hypothetical protein
MKLHLPSMLLGGVLIASFAVNLHASAQETPTVPLTPDPLDSSTSSTGVTIGEWIFDMPGNQSVAVFPLATNATLDGRYVTYVVGVRHPDGTVSGLTECDNAAIICRPSISPDLSALKTADPGDIFVLAGEAKS